MHFYTNIYNALYWKVWFTGLVQVFANWVTISLTCREFWKFWDPPVFHLPTVKPTSSGRIGPVFSHNTECANTDLLFQLRFIHCAMVSPFILPCFPFSLAGKWKGEKFAGQVSRNCMAYTYYVTLIAKCMCTWLHHSLKLLPSAFFSVYRYKSARKISCWDLYACSSTVICQ